jgi:DNA primase
VIVEGYTDALMAHQAGFENVVASLGTALTAGQVALITRYAKKIALAYDVDPAGQRAGTLGGAALEQLIRELARDDTGVELDEVRVVRLPAGKDPDEVLREAPDRWREEVRTAQPIVDHLIDRQAAVADLRTPGGRARFIDAVMPTLRQLPPVMRDGYLAKLRQVSGVEERTLLEVLHRRPAPGGGPGESRITASAVLGAADALPVDQILRAVTPVEAELLRLLLLVPDQQLRVTEELGPDQLPSTPARELFRAIVLARAPNDAGIRPPFERSGFLDALDDETRALALALFAKPGPDPATLSDVRLAYVIDKCLLTLEADRLEQQMAFTRAELAEAERAGDREAMAQLLEQERVYGEARRSLDRRGEDVRLLSRPAGAGRPVETPTHS